MGYDCESMTELQQEIHRRNRKAGWWDQGEKRNLAEVLMLIVTEVAEAMEELRDPKTGKDIKFIKNICPRGYRRVGYLEKDKRGHDKPCGWDSELADVAIRLFDLAEATGVNLESIIREKMEYNLKRPHRHGGKLM